MSQLRELTWVLAAAMATAVCLSFAAIVVR